MKHLTILNRTDDPLLFLRDHSHIRSPSRHTVHVHPDTPLSLLLLPTHSTVISLASSSSSSSSSLLLARHSDLVLDEKPSISCDSTGDPFWPLAPGAAWSLSIPLALGGASWKALDLPPACPWRVYRFRVSRRHHQLLIIPRRNTVSFLADMPDLLPLSSLLLPGTHDTMAFYGWPISQCQALDTPLPIQLRAGIRVLDIRLAVEPAPEGAPNRNPKEKWRLVAYHGPSPQFATFERILRELHAFLSAPASRNETLVVSIKQEDFARTAPALFARLVSEEIARAPPAIGEGSGGGGGGGGWSWWFRENRIPTLGEVRGRAVLFSRYEADVSADPDAGGTQGPGIHPSRWPDSRRDGFEWDCAGTRVRTHDWYSIPSFLSIPEKAALATSNLVLSRPPLSSSSSSSSSSRTLNISFFSAASFPLATPPTVARGFGWPGAGLGIEGVNARVGRWLLGLLAGDAAITTTTTSAVGPGAARSEKEERGGRGEDSVPVPVQRVRGWTFMDFFGDPGGPEGVVPLLVEFNYQAGTRMGGGVTVDGWS